MIKNAHIRKINPRWCVSKIVSEISEKVLLNSIISHKNITAPIMIALSQTQYFFKNFKNPSVKKYFLKAINVMKNTRTPISVTILPSMLSP